MALHFKPQTQLDAIGLESLEQGLKLRHLPEEFIETHSSAVPFHVEPLFPTREADNRHVYLAYGKDGLHMAAQTLNLESKKIFNINKTSRLYSHFDFPFSSLATCFLMSEWPF